MYCRDSAADKDCTCIWKNDSKPQVSVDFTLLIPPSSSSFFLTFTLPLNLRSPILWNIQTQTTVP